MQRLPVGEWLWVWLGGTLLLLGSDHVPVVVAGGFGTLLGPEETPAGLVGCFFWWPLPARDRLTHPCGAFRCLVGVVVVVVGSGCGGVLSVA
jgi:hypothetical protein